MKRIILVFLLFGVALGTAGARGEDNASGVAGNDPAAIALPENMGEAVRREASRVGSELQQHAESVFRRTPMGWDQQTLVDIYDWTVGLPLRLPEFVGHLLEQGRALGLVGSFLVLTFLVAVFYAITGQRRVMDRVSTALAPVRKWLPGEMFPYLLSLVKIVVASLIPLVLLGIYSLISALVMHRPPWYLLIGRLLVVWSVAALGLYVLRESLTSGLYKAAATHGRLIYGRARLVVLYIAGGTAIVWGAEAFALPGDVLAFLRFVITLSVVCVLLLLFSNRKAMFSLLPDLPYDNYQMFRRNLAKYYHPIVYGTFATGLLWCAGYQRLAEFIWTKTWAVAGVYVGFFTAFHLLQGRLRHWSQRSRDQDEETATLLLLLRRGLVFICVVGAGWMMLDLLGVADLLVRLCSFPIVTVGGQSLSCWLFIKAVLIFAVLIYLSAVVRAWLRSSVYPRMGVDTGLAYAVDTFLKYVLFALAFLLVLRSMGLNLKVLMVFAGAAGIGIGLGLQSMAANLIAGFSLIFGRRIRKGDWVEVADTMGRVTDIFLHATKVMTRDNVEYLIPNGLFVANTIVNFTLSSPTIRLSVPVGVSYSADPARVEKIFLAAAARHPELSRHRAPEVRFTGYGDSAINFEVLVWIDIRHIARRKARSLLYFTIFDMLKTENIEIPFPQRDLHIRSGLEKFPA